MDMHIYYSILVWSTGTPFAYLTYIYGDKECMLTYGHGCTLHHVRIVFVSQVERKGCVRDAMAKEFGHSN